MYKFTKNKNETKKKVSHAITQNRRWLLIPIKIPALFSSGFHTWTWHLHSLREDFHLLANLIFVFVSNKWIIIQVNFEMMLSAPCYFFEEDKRRKNKLIIHWLISSKFHHQIFILSKYLMTHNLAFCLINLVPYLNLNLYVEFSWLNLFNFYHHSWLNTKCAQLFKRR